MAVVRSLGSLVRDNFTARAAPWSAAQTVAVFGLVGVRDRGGRARPLGGDGDAQSRRGRERPVTPGRSDARAAVSARARRRGGADREPKRGACGKRSSPAVADLVARLSRTPSVAAIKSLVAPGNQGQISSDGRAALLTFQITGDPTTAQDRVGLALAATAAVQAAHPRLYIGEFGEGSANKAMTKRLAQDFQKAEVTSVPVALFILVLAFGALVAAGVPLLLGLTAVAAALGLTQLVSHLLHVDQSISSAILLIGLAVGIDYSLFYVRREREERARGSALAAPGCHRRVRRRQTRRTQGHLRIRRREPSHANPTAPRWFALSPPQDTPHAPLAYDRRRLYR